MRGEKRKERKSEYNIASDKSLLASFGEFVSSVAIFGQAIYLDGISVASSAQMCGLGHFLFLAQLHSWKFIT